MHIVFELQGNFIQETSKNHAVPVNPLEYWENPPEEWVNPPDDFSKSKHSVKMHQNQMPESESAPWHLCMGPSSK